MTGRARAAAIAETLSGLALVAWVGGYAALGAFGARIVFRDLPRAQAAPTMTTIFRSFDSLVVVAVVVLLGAALVRGWARGLHSRADQVALGSALGLVALGAFDLLYVHPQIAAMFHAGRTLEPGFAALHHLSERCGHLEVLLTAALFGAQAWSHEPS